MRGFNFAKIRLGLALIGVEVCGLGWVENCKFIVSSSLENLVWAWKLLPYRSSLGFRLRFQYETLIRALARHGWAAKLFLSKQLVGDCQLWSGLIEVIAKFISCPQYLRLLLILLKLWPILLEFRHFWWVFDRSTKFACAITFFSRGLRFQRWWCIEYLEIR